MVVGCSAKSRAAVVIGLKPGLIDQLFLSSVQQRDSSFYGSAGVADSHTLHIKQYCKSPQEHSEVKRTELGSKNGEGAESETYAKGMGSS